MYIYNIFGKQMCLFPLYHVSGTKHVYDIAICATTQKKGIHVHDTMYATVHCHQS